MLMPPPRAAVPFELWYPSASGVIATTETTAPVAETEEGGTMRPLTRILSVFSLTEKDRFLRDMRAGTAHHGCPLRGAARVQRAGG